MKAGVHSMPEACSEASPTVQLAQIEVSPTHPLLLLKRAVVFQKWRWPYLHRSSKGIAINKQANDDIVHLCRFRKADGLADQAFNARSGGLANADIDGNNTL